MSTATTFLGGIVFGLALAAPPGPMNAVIASESALRGWVAGVRAGLGAMTADACFLVLAYVGLVAVVDRSPTTRAVLFAIGGVLMLYFAYDAVADAREFGEEGDETDETGKGFRKAFALAITNPFQIAFWLTVGVGLLDPGEIDPLAPLPVVGEALAGTVVFQTGHPAIAVGLFAGIVVWITTFPAAIVRLRRRVSRTGPIVAWLSAAVLAGFGIHFLLEGLTSL